MSHSHAHERGESHLPTVSLRRYTAAHSNAHPASSYADTNFYTAYSYTHAHLYATSSHSYAYSHTYSDPSNCLAL